jgi:type IV pilus assembly protein PilV
MRLDSSRHQRGVTLVEVLVTMVILAIGLLGLVGLQARLQILQLEAYQRAQALMLLKDMSGRVANNRNNAAAYVTGPVSGLEVPLGVGMTCPSVTSPATRQAADAREWCLALQGASETIGAASTRVGAMVGGRGCIEPINPAEGVYMVTVAWQGLAPISAPPESVDCGLGAFDGGVGSACVNDLCRRTVTTLVIIPNLT